MTTPVTPDAVEAAARALYDLAPWIVNGYDGTTFTWDQIGADNRADYLDQATAALAAAAPLIAAEAWDAGFTAGRHIQYIGTRRTGRSDNPYRAATLTTKEN